MSFDVASSPSAKCGLDGYWVTNQMLEQERVLRRLTEVALTKTSRRP